MGKYADLLLTGAGDESSAMRESMTPEQRAKADHLMFGGGNRPPAAAPQAQPMPQQPQAPPAPRRYSDELLAPQPTATAAPPEANQEGWGEWLKNSIVGRQDPREAATGTVFEQYPEELRSPTATGAMLGANDAGMGDIISKNLGDRFMRRETDANGYEVIVTRGPDGKEQRGYVNKPGLDTQDAWRTFYGAAPYVVSGGAAGTMLKGAGIGANALGQGAAAAATSFAGDIGALTQGSEQAPDLEKAGIMGLFGAAGPPISAAGGALWRKFVTIPGLIDKQSGMLTAKGIEAARKAGLEPSDITPDFAQGFAKSLAETGDEATAAVRAGTQRYGIPASQGQATKDPYLLTQEEGMRRRLYGEQAQNTMLGFDKQQADAIKGAALGRMPYEPPAPSVATAINPGRAQGFAPKPDEIGSSIQGGAQSAKQAARVMERDAWAGATGLEATDEALKTLPATLNTKLSGRMLNERVTPKAAEMAKEIDRIIAGGAPEKAAGWVTTSPTRNVDQMRRSLLALSKSAVDPPDRAAADAIYEGFNDWIADAAKNSLLKGDPGAALKLVGARGFTREVREVFSPKTADGKLSPAGARLAKILDSSRADSGAAVVEALFGSQGSTTANSGVTGALRNLKTAFDRYAPVTGKEAWDDVRFAYWSRLVTNKGGEILGPKALETNLRQAMHGKDNVMQVLYTPAEQREIRSFFKAIQAVAYKPPNASGSGFTAASFIKDGLLKLLDSFGVGKATSATLNYTGVGNAWNAAGARQAVSQTVRPMPPNLTPAVTSAGQAYNQSGR